MASQKPGRRSPTDWDPELGTKPVGMFDPSRPRQEPIEVVVTEPPTRPIPKDTSPEGILKSAIGPGIYNVPRGQGKRKTRKTKKSHKKTQKRRARK